MRGYPYYNYDEFLFAEQKFRDLGYDVVNPHNLDLDSCGFDVTKLPSNTDWSKIPENLDLKELVIRDISALTTCDAIYFLDGYEKSVGALAEKAVARWLNIEVMTSRASDISG